jgi:hypothetical protein
MATSFDTIKPFIESSERKFVKELLGFKTYTDLVNYYDSVAGSGSFGSGDGERDVYSDLLALVQKSLINLAYFHGYPVLGIQATIGGFHRVESESIKGLYKYQEEDLKDLFKNDGYNGLDDVLEFLEENIEYFNYFENSEKRLNDRKNIVPDTKTFNNIYDIGTKKVYAAGRRPEDKKNSGARFV